MSLAKLASFTEESPWWCPVPRVRVPTHGPRPEPWATLWQALRLHRYAAQLAAHQVGGDAADRLSRAALRLYDEADCGNVPWQVLVHWLRDPPPPPPPWLELVGHAVGQAVIAARLGGEIGRQLGGAAAAVIAQGIGPDDGA